MKSKKLLCVLGLMLSMCMTFTACGSSGDSEASSADTEPTSEQESQEEYISIYEGKCEITASWTTGETIYTTNTDEGTFDPSIITENGCFAVTYSGTRAQIYLAFQDMTNWEWKSVNVPTLTESTDGGYVSYFSFEDCAAIYGSTDFSDLGSFTVGTTQSTETVTITAIEWGAMPEEKEMTPTSIDLSGAEMLYTGTATASTQGENLTFFYTKHVGGEWDASLINEGSSIYVEYSGEKDGVYLAFASASGATNWVAVYPDDTGINEKGNYYSLFNYETFSKAFGTNFARLDQIQAYCAKDKAVTLKQIAYLKGEGAAVDTSEGTWDRAETGIAFIGDSIVQNPLVDTTHLGGIDWNGIFGKENCSNYGIGGQTTKECVARIDEIASKNYDTVVMLCGINDIGRNLTNAQIIANYETMVNALVTSNAKMEIYIVSVLPTTPVYYTNSQDKIVALNAELKAFAEKNSNVTFVDVHSSFVQEDGYCNPDLVFDGLHPNLQGYMKLADILGPYLYENYTHNNLIVDNSHMAEQTYAETTIYSGETEIANAWTMGPAGYTKKAGGSFDPSVITEGGCFMVQYTGSAEKVYLAFQDATNWTWTSVNMPTYTVETENGYVSYFSLEDCIKVYGTSDFSDLGAVIVGSTDSTEKMVITKLSWGSLTE